jgi:preprotein translocase subunit YajC
VLAADSASQSGLPSLLFFAVLLGGMYLLLIRPVRARARQQARVRAELEIGRKVMTTSGLIGRVAALEDDDTVLLEIAPGVRARFVAQAIGRTLDDPPADPPAGPAAAPPAGTG